jgi:hypothetical protein
MSTPAWAERKPLVIAVVVVAMLTSGVTFLLGGGWPDVGAALAGAVSSATGRGSTEPATPGVVGTGLVQVTGAATTAPAAAGVAVLLDRHFTAINQHDFAGWSTTVSGRRVTDQSRRRWESDFRSTSDSAVVVSAIKSTSAGLLVDLTFVSTQDTADAPADLPVTRICWSSRWPIENLAAGGRIGIPAKGATSKRPC